MEINFSCIDLLARTLRVEENFTHVDKCLLTWQVSRVSDDGDAFRTGGARLGQRSGTPPTIFALADVAALRVELCSGEAAESLFSSSLRRAVDPGDDPGVCRAAMCMICPAVLPAMPVASSINVCYYIGLIDERAPPGRSGTSPLPSRSYKYKKVM